jgi:hypothetical protein
VWGSSIKGGGISGSVNQYNRSRDFTKDQYGIEKAILLFCLSDADTMFLIDSRVTESRIKHIKLLVEQGIHFPSNNLHSWGTGRKLYAVHGSNDHYNLSRMGET